VAKCDVCYRIEADFPVLIRNVRNLSHPKRPNPDQHHTPKLSPNRAIGTLVCHASAHVTGGISLWHEKSVRSYARGVPLRLTRTL
jgi:hypothetical protein